MLEQILDPGQVDLFCPNFLTIFKPLFIPGGGFPPHFLKPFLPFLMPGGDGAERARILDKNHSFARFRHFACYRLYPCWPGE